MYTIYGADWCSYCVKAKAFMEERGLEYSFLDIDEEEIADELLERLPEPTTSVPQVFLGNEWIGGYDDLVAKFN